MERWGQNHGVCVVPCEMGVGEGEREGEREGWDL